MEKLIDIGSYPVINVLDKRVDLFGYMINAEKIHFFW